MSFVKTILIVSLCILTFACGGGSSSSSADNSVNSDVSRNSSNFINADKSSINLDVNFNQISESEIVKLTFQGDGVVVGYKEGAEVFSWLDIRLDNVTLNSADLILDPSGIRIDSLEPLTSTLTVATSNADGTGIVLQDIEINIMPHDGIDVIENDLSLFGRWGESSEDTFDLLIDTIALDWQLTSNNPYINFSPSTGSGKTDVIVSINSDELPVNKSNFDIDLTTNTDESIKLVGSIEIVAPFIRELASINFEPLHQGSERKVSIPIILSNNANAPWSVELPSWLNATSINGVSSENELEVSLNVDNLPIDDGIYEEKISVSINIPGASLEEEAEVSLKNVKKRLLANRPILAFSNYLFEKNNGEITLNHPVEDLNVTASDGWVHIDEKSFETIKFHIEPEGLEDGFHKTKILIGNENDPLLENTEVTVSYFKSNNVSTSIQNYVFEDSSIILNDKLGPWVYIIPANIIETDNDLVIDKYNYITGEIDEQYTLSNVQEVRETEISYDGNSIYLSTFSNDGLSSVLYYEINLLDNSILLNNTLSDYFTERFNVQNISGIDFFYNDSGTCVNLILDDFCHRLDKRPEHNYSNYKIYSTDISFNQINFNFNFYDFFENELYTETNRITHDFNGATALSSAFNYSNNKLFILERTNNLNSEYVFNSYIVDSNNSEVNINIEDSFLLGGNFTTHDANISITPNDNILISFQKSIFDEESSNFFIAYTVKLFDEKLNEISSIDTSDDGFIFNEFISADGKILGYTQYMRKGFPLNIVENKLIFNPLAN